MTTKCNTLSGTELVLEIRQSKSKSHITGIPYTVTHLLIRFLIIVWSPPPPPHSSPLCPVLFDASHSLCIIDYMFHYVFQYDDKVENSRHTVHLVCSPSVESVAQPGASQSHTSTEKVMSSCCSASSSHSHTSTEKVGSASPSQSTHIHREGRIVLLLSQSLTLTHIHRHSHTSTQKVGSASPSHSLTSAEKVGSASLSHSHPQRR